MALNLPSTPLQPFNVLAFDPGGTTGWAQAILPCPIQPDDTVELKDIQLTTGELGPNVHHKELYQFVMLNAHDASTRFPYPKLEVVFEPFHFRQHLDNPRHKVNLVSCEYIGVIKLACQQLGLTYYDRFVPGEAKAYCPNAKLELLGWLQTPITPMRHQNDALRQLVKYLIVKKKVRHPITTAWRVED